MQHPNHTLQTAEEKISARESSGRRPRLCTTTGHDIWTIHVGSRSDLCCSSTWISPKHRVAPSELPQVEVLSVPVLLVLGVHRYLVQGRRRHLKTRLPLVRSCWHGCLLLLFSSFHGAALPSSTGASCAQHSSWRAGGSSRTSPPGTLRHCPPAPGQLPAK